MSGLIRAIDKVAAFGAGLAALALLAMFALGLSEVVMREVFSSSIPVSLEYSGYLVAFCFLWGSGWTFRQGRHVRLNLVSPRPETARFLDILAHLAALVLAAILALGVILWALGSLELGSVSYFPSATPLWIPQALLAVGPVILFLSVLAGFLETLGRKPA